MKIKIVYSDQVNIPLYFLDDIHPFDTTKFKKIYDLMINSGTVGSDDVIQGRMCSLGELLLIHTERYLESLGDSEVIARICQVSPLKWIPNFILQWYLITPMWYHTGNTITGALEAITNGNGSICLSGGMHHASSDSGGGWCFFSDISIAIRVLNQQKWANKFMIIDLDYHRGNGYQKDKYDGLLTSKKEDVYIMDVYSKFSYPSHGNEISVINANGAVDISDAFKELNFHPSVYMVNEINDDSDKYSVMSDDIFTDHFDKYYLDLVESLLEKSFSEFNPDIVFYNAGSDVLEDDPLGSFQLSRGGLEKRDEIVVTYCVKMNIPFVMLLSGGYGKDNYKTVQASIANIIKKFGENIEK